MRPRPTPLCYRLTPLSQRDKPPLLHIGEEVARTVYLTPRVAIGRVEILENVAELSVTNDLAKQVSNVTKRARTLVEKRHRMMHDYWGVDIETGMPSRMAIPQKASKPKKIVSLEELTATIQDIRVLATDARELTAALYASWPPHASLRKSGLPRQVARAKATRRSKDAPQAPRRQRKSSPK